MRAATATIIVLALSSLSCDVFQRSEPSALVRSVDHMAAIPLPSADADPADAARTAGALEGPAVPLASSMSEAASSTALAIELQILEELRARHTALSERELHRLASTIVDEAHRHDLEPALVLAVIQVESGGYHLAVSPVGALGLMQLLPSTAEELALDLGLPWRGPNSLFDPILNVKLGTAYLSRLSAKYGSVSTALAAYNWGPGRIDRRLRRGGSLPRIYIEQVMKFYDAGSKMTLASSS
jgi:soluble lytic murein transglycosylase-like protein